jgi:epoxyqueuosine reductase
MTAMSLEQQIKDKALALGFDAVGITDASPVGAEHLEHFETWLRCGYAGQMDYMHQNLDKRTHPAQLLEGAKSVIVVALGYKPPAPALVPIDPGGAVGKVAQYAQYEDYHPFMKALLSELAGFIRTNTEGEERLKICIDSAPLAEKALAVRAGVGFIGRNHLLTHPQLGPGILLGEIVTTVTLRPDSPAGGSCPGCDRCLKACPTGALRPDGFLDARRCISYQTQYGSPDESAVRTDNWLFGCDECLLACPFQQAAPACANRRFKWYPERAELDLRGALGLSVEEFQAEFNDAPVRRLGLGRMKRNAWRCLKS